jgi:DNA-binding NtrC family response regulator
VAKILCVDDDRAVIGLKREIIERAGHSVTACDSVEDAVRVLAQINFDAVVTDWRLGEGRGQKVVAAAKRHSSVPVVVISGYMTEAFQAPEPLADLYLEKPADPAELVQILEALLKTSVSSANS